MGWTVLKKRIIPVQLLLDNRLVKTKKFSKPIDVGDPIKSSKIYNDCDADELIFLNINKDKKKSISELFNIITQVSKVCFMPISLGGGIQSLDQAKMLLKEGADKIVLNSISYKNDDIIEKISGSFGRQAVVVSIDVKKNSNNYFLFSQNGKTKESPSLENHILKCVERGAGEIFINSIDNDGCKQGYDIDLIKYVSKISKVPVIGCGGAGKADDLRDAFIETNVSALACGSIFLFTDNNPLRLKSYLQNYDIKFKIIK
jgi:cyclase